MLVADRLAADVAVPLDRHLTHQIRAAHDPDQLPPGQDRHPPDPPLDQQEADLLNVRLLVHADDARRHDVAGQLAAPGQQVVLADQPDHRAVLVGHRNGADLVPRQQRGDVADRGIGLVQTTGAVMISLTFMRPIPP